MARQNCLDYQDILTIYETTTVDPDMETQIIRPLLGGMSPSKVGKILNIKPNTNFIKELEAMKCIEEYEIIELLTINADLEWDHVFFAIKNGIDVYYIIEKLKQNPNLNVKTIE